MAMHECKTKMANSKIFSIDQLVQHEFNCQQQHQHLCIINQSGPSLLFIRALPRYATAANVHLRTVGEKRPVIANCKWQYLIKKVLHGPFQHISTLIPFQSKSIFRNAENGKTGATNQ